AIDVRGVSGDGTSFTEPHRAPGASIQWRVRSRRYSLTHGSDLRRPYQQRFYRRDRLRAGSVHLINSPRHWSGRGGTLRKTPAPPFPPTQPAKPARILAPLPTA